MEASVDRVAFEKVASAIESGKDLTLEMIESVFGAAFSMMLVYTLMDSNDAARAISGAIARLSAGEARVGEEPV